MTHDYPEKILAQLAIHGVRPGPTTRPELLHEFVNDLYRFELRRLRRRQVAGEILKNEYVPHVVALRKKYILISIPVRRWTDPGPNT